VRGGCARFGQKGRKKTIKTGKNKK